MLFQRKVDRAMEHLAKQVQQRQEPDQEEPELEQGDWLALLLSALVVLLPVCLLVLLALGLVAFLPLL